MKNEIYLKKTVDLMKFFDAMVEKHDKQNINSSKIVRNFDNKSELISTVYSIYTGQGGFNHSYIKIIEGFTEYKSGDADIYIKVGVSFNGTYTFDSDSVEIYYDIEKGEIEVEKYGIFERFSPTEAFSYIKHVFDFLAN